MPAAGSPGVHAALPFLTAARAHGPHCLGWWICSGASMGLARGPPPRLVLRGRFPELRGSSSAVASAVSSQPLSEASSGAACSGEALLFPFTYLLGGGMSCVPARCLSPASPRVARAGPRPLAGALGGRGGLALGPRQPPVLQPGRFLLCVPVQSLSLLTSSAVKRSCSILNSLFHSSWFWDFHLF